MADWRQRIDDLRSRWKAWWIDAGLSAIVPVILLTCDREAYLDLEEKTALAHVLIHLGSKQRRVVAVARSETVYPELTTDETKWVAHDDKLELLFTQQARMRPLRFKWISQRTTTMTTISLDTLLDLATNHLWVAPAFRAEVRQRTEVLVRHKLAHPYTLEGPGG